MPAERKNQPKQDSSKEQDSQQSESTGDLEEREYRDSQGNIHHHTHKYMEDHGKARETKK